ncbi:MAG: L-seryl-tRNA(Sec) selenium transferase [Thermaerobacterales bacterium]
MSAKQPEQQGSAGLRAIPAVHRLLESPGGVELAATFGHERAATALAQAADQIRQQVLAGGSVDTAALRPETITERAAAALAELACPGPHPVINATGIVLHTNLGRAVLADSARRMVDIVSSRYTNLEYDLPLGERGSRHAHAEPLLQAVTGAEAAMVVNNNAAAVLLALSAVAAPGEVIVSRGELVEIGGAFRIPDVMAQSGAAMVETGTTNKTHLHDYRAAITENTAMLLKVHTSNYRIVGFTQDVPLTDLAQLGRQFELPLMIDLGSGVIPDVSPFGLTGEPTVAETLEQGADLVTFSGDKLFGGPQAGILAGSRALIDRCRRHPLARALRVDKLTLAALTATLALYLKPDRAMAEIPTLRMLTCSESELAGRAAQLARRLGQVLPSTVGITVVAGTSQAGGGALPELDLPTSLVSLTNLAPGISAWERLLRRRRPPVIARLHHDTLLLDPRTIFSDQEETLIQAFAAVSRLSAG